MNQYYGSDQSREINSTWHFYCLEILQSPPARFSRKYLEFEKLIWSAEVSPVTFGTETFLLRRIAGLEESVPDCEEKSAVVGSVHGAPGVVSVVLEAGVDDPVVRRDEAVLVAAVKVDSVTVEKQAVPKCVGQCWIN